VTVNYGVVFEDEEMSLRARIGKGILVNGFGQGVTILGQIITLPTLLVHWGSVQYGEWLMLSVIPQYLALSDMGFSSVAGNEIAMATGRGDVAGAQGAFRGALVANVVASTIVLLLSAILIGLQVHLSILPIQGLSLSVTASLLVIFGMQVCCTFFLNCAVASFRGGGQYPYGALLNNLARLAEVFAIVIPAWLGATPIVVATSVLLVRVVAVVMIFMQLRLRFFWSKFVLDSTGVGVAKKLISPCLGYMALPVSTALSQSGTVLVIGSLLGPTQVVTFTAMRTLARLLVQLSSVINSPIMPEISAAYATSNISLVRRLHAGAMRAAVVIGAFGGGLLFVGAPFVLKYWTKKHIVFDPDLFLALLTGVAFNILWGTSAIVLLAVNLHTRITLWALALSATGLALCVGLGRIFGTVDSIAYGAIAQEVVMLVIVLSKSLKSMKQDKMQFIFKLLSAQG
jgi:O-antigen/teichoic acid export membrane protein